MFLLALNLLLRVSVVTAQVTAPSCDLRELERQCDTQICQATEVPRLSDISARTDRNSPIDPNTERAFISYRNYVRERARILHDQLNAATPETLWQKLLSEKDPMSFLNSFFSRNCSSGFGSVFLNDLSPDVELYRPLAEVFSTLSAYEDGLSSLTYLMNSKNSLRTSPNNKESVLYTVESLVWATRSDPEKAPKYADLRQRLLANTPLKKADLSLIAEPERASLRRAFFLEKRNVIVAALGAQLEEHRRYSVENDLQRIDQSCRVKAQVARLVRDASDAGKFQSTVNTVIQSFQERLIPLLSSHTRTVIAPKLTQELFHLLPVDFDESFNTSNLTGEQNIEINLYEVGFVRSKACRISSLESNGKGSLYEHSSETIQISPLQLVYGGEGVLYHELGHHVSQLMNRPDVSAESKEKFLRLKECLGQMHGGSSQYIEEDFADLVAAKTYQGNRSYGCEFQRMILSENRPESFYTSNPNDVHSNDLFRELHMRLNQNGQVPASCRQLMEHSSEAPKRCEL